MTVGSDIVCLQETHWDDECMREIEREWGGQIYVNNGGVKSRGVAILVKRGAIENVRECVNDGDGRVIGITFEHLNKRIQLLNVYAPNEERERRDFFERLGGMCEENCVIVGDFNVWCGRLDVTARMDFRSDISRSVLKRVMREKDLMDVWRERNPEGRVFSRKQVVRGELKQSRIDLVLSTKGIINNIGKIEYKFTALSDHMVLKFALGQGWERRGGGVWCLNESLLKDERYKEKVRECMEMRKNERMYEEDIGRWWEELKKEIKHLSIEYSKSRNSRERGREIRLKRELTREAEKIERELNYDIGEYIRIKEELKEIEGKRCRGAIVRSRARYTVEGEKCTKFFLGLEKARQKSSYLEQVEGKNGEIIKDLVGIIERVEGFYKELFQRGEVDEENLEQVLHEVEAKLSEEDRERCDDDIGTGEIEAAIIGLGKNKSPGIDGLIGEFYVEFREELLPVLGRLYRRIEETGEMPQGMSTGLVTIIHKGGSRDRLENYRPLSMLNTDYKILARVMANRMKRVIGTVVGNTQAYSIPGRDIADTISSIRDTIHHMKSTKGGIVLSLDLNKAFDRVDHSYLYRVLEKMGFGHRLVGWIKRMYDRALSCVKINGIVTDTFRLERSVRQGCPLSALLYSLAAEPLAALVKHNHNIRGVELPGGHVSLIYQYADDTTLTVRDRESVVEVFSSLEQYCRVSGAKINIDKSKIMYVGADRRERVEIGLVEEKEYLRILGINLGIEDRKGRDIQLEGIVNRIRKTLGGWKHRRLKIRGKVIVVNTLIISKLVYVMNVVDIPERVLKEVEQIISEFLWDGKGVRIAKEVLENEYGDGGLKLINLARKKKALRVKSMVRYLGNKDNHVWKIFLREAINKCGECGESGVYMDLKTGMVSGVSDYYKELLGAWGEFVKCVKYECMNVRQVWEQPIFLNPKITFEGSTMFNGLIWRAGIRKVRDLVYEHVPGFMRAQVIVDEVRQRGDDMWLGTAERMMEQIKDGMPKEWVGMIERENDADEEGKIEMYVGEGEVRLSLMSVKTRVIYRLLRVKDVRRPAAEKVWEKVMKGMNVRRMWENLRVKFNSSECENLDFLLRHNRVFNNLIISKFDMNVKKECDVCTVGVETCMHEFVECVELQSFFKQMKELITRCWKERFVETMEWRELWLFGVKASGKGCNVNLLNYVLSHARYAVKLRRNRAHYEKRKIPVWTMFKSIIKRNIQMLHSFIEEEDFQDNFAEGSTFVKMEEDGAIAFELE